MCNCTDEQPKPLYKSWQRAADTTAENVETLGPAEVSFDNLDDALQGRIEARSSSSISRVTRLQGGPPIKKQSI